MKYNMKEIFETTIILFILRSKKKSLISLGFTILFSPVLV